MRRALSSFAVAPQQVRVPDPMSRNIAVLVSLSALALAALACETGQVLPPDEATQAAILTRQPGSQTGAAEGAEFKVGDMVQFSGVSFLVPLRAAPGESQAVSHVSRGDTAEILEVVSLNDVVWYKVDSQGGEGWVTPNNLKLASGLESSFSVGDEAYLIGRSFLINLYDGPGSTRFIAGQERGAKVTILEVDDVGGITWYRVNAPTGEGWVSEESLSSEPPS